MTTTCSYPSGPPLNTDVGGIGVRLSFYLQTIFIAWLVARSTSVGEISTALYTLIATNMAMVATTLILAFNESPASISFHDALVVFYLIYISWVTIVFSLPALSRIQGRSCTKCGKAFKEGSRSQYLGIVSVMQSYFAFGFAFCLLATAPKFGSDPACNKNAVVVLFRPFNALKAGRTFGWTVTAIVVVLYTAMTLKDYTPSKVKAITRRVIRRKQQKKRPIVVTDDDENPVSISGPHDIVVDSSRMTPPVQVPKPRGYDSGIAWSMSLELIATTILWALAVMNTELLLFWNRIRPVNDWQYGQILALALVVVPFMSVIKVFRKYGLRHSHLYDRVYHEEKLIHEDCGAIARMC
ncbi:hypothetical protein D9758_010664 [Tetrapyrgos nigripes]|uniref:Uncharacterized protein n=1 Tax=Tetrapyrgos nigripes TaxID=182062 RepID=A0A8H5GG77_9AGAR|nr:hypothetical protein D9758_010664 [Tetrapyrgos nigripes]